MKKILQKIIGECYPYIQKGKVATYIPELAKADPNEFGICTISFEQGINGFGKEFYNAKYCKGNYIA